MQQHEAITQLQQKISGLQNMYMGTAAAVSRSSLVVEEIKAAVSHPMFKSTATTTTTPTEATMRTLTDDIKQEVSDVRITTQTLLSTMNDLGGRDVAWLMRPALEKVVRDILEDDRDVFNRGYDQRCNLESGNNRITSEARVATALRTMYSSTVYHSPWIGTITVTRKATITRKWDSQMQKFELQTEDRVTEVRLKPAIWVSKHGIDVRVDQVKALYGPPKVGITLEPVRYVQMHDEIFPVLEAGNILALRQMLTEGRISIKDRDCYDGSNLLETSLYVMTNHWWATPDSATPDAYIIRLCRWLLSQDVPADFQGSNPLIGNEDDAYLWMCNTVGSTSIDAATQVNDMETLLTACIADARPIRGARLLLRFVMSNPRHSRYVDCLILDLLKEAAIESWDEDMHYLEKAHRDYWAREQPEILGSEYSMLSGLLKTIKREVDISKGASMPFSRVEALKGLRRVFIRYIVLFFLYEDSSVPAIAISVEFVSNLIQICRSTSMLEDGFRDYLYKYACRHDILGPWHMVLHTVDRDSNTTTRDSSMVRASVPSPARVTVHVDDDPKDAKSKYVMISGKDPHAYGDEETQRSWGLLESCYKPIYDSVKVDKNKWGDVCAIRQEGTELHLECGITDPEYPHEGRWEAERAYWADFDQAYDYYTREEYEEEEDSDPPPPPPSPPQAPGLAYRLASQGVSILSTIV